MTGTGEGDANSLVFTGGMEGIIKVWDISSEVLGSDGCLKGAWLNYQTREEKEIEKEAQR